MDDDRMSENGKTDALSQVATPKTYVIATIANDKVYDWLSRLSINPFPSPGNAKLFGPTKRYVGFKRALASRKRGYWRSWEETEPEETTAEDPPFTAGME